jgi:hypothetical protein
MRGLEEQRASDDPDAVVHREMHLCHIVSGDLGLKLSHYSVSASDFAGESQALLESCSFARRSTRNRRLSNRLLLDSTRRIRTGKQ